MGVDNIKFTKWHGTGNDFILLNGLEGSAPALDQQQIASFCDRHFGVGSDGLIILADDKDPGIAYEMIFFNPDGSQSFCGNGSRCAFAAWSAISGDRGPINFRAIDGIHTAAWNNDRVRISMRDVHGIETIGPNVRYLHTGSPHLLVWVDDPMQADLTGIAHEWRYSERFKKEGVNVNLLAWKDDHLVMRTYERGVEDETLSCGTGVTAAALGTMFMGHTSGPCRVLTKGGELQVEANITSSDRATEIFLTGPVAKVFHGQYLLA